MNHGQHRFEDLTVPTVWTPYCGIAPLPDAWAGRWNLDPILLAILGLCLIVALARLQGRERIMGVGAVIVLAVSFVSPLCALSSALFSARTVHHILLVAFAAPLLAWAAPRMRVGPLALATLAHAGIFWAWHAPGAYSWALSNDGAYWLMQISLLASGVWFWAGVRSASALGAVGALLIGMVTMGLLGALILFSGEPLYAPHLLTTTAWSLTALQDQQAAGLIMWAPAAGVYLASALVILGRWIGPDRPLTPAQA